MGGAEVFIALIFIGIPMLTFGMIFRHWFKLKEKRLEVESGLAIEN